MSIKDLTIVITSFRSKTKIKKCLNSIDKNCSIINVENSDDTEFKKSIEKEFVNVKCILTGKNLGYGSANNIGLRETKTKYALIINPDTELYPETLKAFLLSAQENPDFAIIAPNIIYAETKTKINYAGKPKIHKAKNVKGFAMFLNLSQFKDIGFFDESFFIYLEEIDLCRRLINKSKKIYWDSNIPIFHQGGQSHDNIVNYQMELSRNWHWMWSTFYYNKKYKGFLISFLMVAPKMLSSSIKFFIYFLLFNKEKKEIYYQRLSGLFNAVIGKNSWYRPKV
jgi:N-acetylglucosaminyl-diphospho-decaprenol L-rhamnosyltransferase